MNELMNLPNAPLEHTDADSVYDNLSDMKLLRTQLEVRLKKLRRQFKELKAIYDSEDANDLFMDEWMNIGSTAASASEDLESYLAYVDDEINKVTKGVLIMETLKDEMGREALRGYITIDTEMSLQSIAKTCDSFGSIIRTLQTIKRNALNNEE